MPPLPATPAQLERGAGPGPRGKARGAHAAELARNVVEFALVSGIGLALDFGLFLLLVQAGIAPGCANAISATCAVVFVFFASVHRIFRYAGGFLAGLFLAYLAYQIAAVAAASAAVGYLVEQDLSAALAKLVTIPVTFAANYLFMTLLTRAGRRLSGVSNADKGA